MTKPLGQKRHFEPDQVSIIRHRLEAAKLWRELALLEVGLATMLRVSDLQKLTWQDVQNMDGTMRDAARLRTKKTGRLVDVPLTERAKTALMSYWQEERGYGSAKVFGVSERQMSRWLKRWVKEYLGVDPSPYAMHSLRRTRPALIYRETKNLAAIQHLLGHTSVNSTVKYLGVDRDDALDLAKRFEV